MAFHSPHGPLHGIKGPVKTVDLRRLIASSTPKGLRDEGGAGYKISGVHPRNKLLIGHRVVPVIRSNTTNGSCGSS